MKREEVEHLSLLARIALTEKEATELAGDISNILRYVSEIDEITPTKREKKVGALYNIMREDGVPHTAGIYTDDLLNEAPERQGKYIKVKKILGGEG